MKFQDPEEFNDLDDFQSKSTQQQRPQSPSPKSATSANDSVTNAEHIGLFDPEHQDDQQQGPVVTVGRYLLYRDIYAFIDSCKDVANTRPHTYTSVKAAIPFCLRGSAKMWYTSELTELEKTLLRDAPLEKWYSTLIDHFKMRANIALKLLQNQAYGYREIRDGVTPRAYIQSMLHLAKAANNVTTST